MSRKLCIHIQLFHDYSSDFITSLCVLKQQKLFRLLSIFLLNQLRCLIHIDVQILNLEVILNIIIKEDFLLKSKVPILIHCIGWQNRYHIITCYIKKYVNIQYLLQSLYSVLFVIYFPRKNLYSTFKRKSLFLEK